MNVFSNKIKFKSLRNTFTSNEYYYNIKNFLENIFIDYNNSIYLCFYFVDKTQPILSYLLKKYDEELNFFKLDNSNNNSIKLSSLSYIKGNFNCNFKVKGYKYHDNNMFIFIELDNKEENNLGEWCIMDEICNKRKFLDTNISEIVSSFFLNNHNFIYLQNKDNLNIEIPIVAFKNNNNIIDLMYSKYKSNGFEFYDYEHCEKKNLLRYILFITSSSVYFNELYQYKVNYICKPVSIHQ